MFDLSHSCRKAIHLTRLLLLLITIAAQAQIPQVGWTQLNGPYTALNPRALSIGSSSETTVIYASANFGLYKSTNDGITWTQITAITSSVKLVTCAKDDPNIVYIAQGTALKKTTNGGSTWTTITGTITNTSFTSISIKPGTSNQTVYVGCDINGSNRTLWFTTNSGTSWTVEPFDKFVKITKIAFNPSTPNQIFISASNGLANEIGVWKRDPGSGQWSRKVTGMTGRLNITALTINPVNPSEL